MVLKHNGNLSRTILALFGRVTYSRATLIPADKNSADILFRLDAVKSIFPLDCALGIDKLPFKVTYQMMAAITKEAVRAKSYADACVSIEEKYHVQASSVYVEKITDYVGGLVYAAQQKEADDAKASICAKFDGRKRRKRKNDVLYLEIDGAMVHIRDKKEHGGWTESKHSVAFNSADIRYYESKDGETVNHRILKRDFVGYIGEADEFRYHFLALAKRNDSDKCRELVVISDGASWIRNMVRTLLPRATRILDLYHAKENAGKFANAVKRGKVQKKQFANQLCSLIDEGDVNELLKILKPFEGQKMPTGIPNLYTYVFNNRDAMDYPAYKAKGYFVGSGAIESANRNLMQNRMKLQGMRWNLYSGQCMLSLKAKYEAGKWSEVVELLRRHCYGP